VFTLSPRSGLQSAGRGVNSEPLNVLLLSPLPGLDPPNGDVTYTEQLLAHAPPGVTYVRYDDALRDGSLVERFRKRSSSPHRGSRRSGDALRFVREVGVNKVRQTGLLFSEPFRHFDVAPGAFDLVHAHVFSVHLNDRPPLVMSNSVLIDALYRDAFRASPRWVTSARLIDTWLARATGVTHSSYVLQSANAVVCFSDFLRRTLVARGVDPRRLYVVPPGIELGPEGPPGGQTGQRTIGFIGDWDAKGGDVVLEAHARLRSRGHDVALTVVGSEPRLGVRASQERKITWLPRQPRDLLLRDVIPTFSVFAYPSRFDGLPLTLLEVMAAGVPVVVSDYGALPEVVEFGRAGSVVPVDNGRALADAIDALFNPERGADVAARARARVETAFEATVTADELRRVYFAAAAA
jgi:glycosyltransferase involved in cell wall biosynthesis